MGEHYKTYEDVLTALEKKGRKAHLLLGNGFSMAYDTKIFSYNALHDFVAKIGDAALVKLFEAIKTKNFEVVMKQLDLFVALLDAFESKEGLQTRVKEAGARLQRSLLDAVSALHPEHVFKLPADRLARCAEFLNTFLAPGGNIFTTNYDLLLYWVLLRGNVPNHVDGFGRELLLNPAEAQQGEEQDWSELRWGPNRSQQNVHYLHGALPLFDTGLEIVKEQYTDNAYLLENIATRLEKSEYPIFVTAGNGDEKLERIRHNRYLTFCYDQLCTIDGSLVAFGFNFGEYDLHIIDAINKAARQQDLKSRLWSVYIGVYTHEDASRIASIEERFHCKVNTFDAKTAAVWG